MSALQANGSDGVVSEHEDALLSIDEGLAKAVELLQQSSRASQLADEE